MSYNPERKKVEDARKQLYRDFALKYNEIQKLELSESEKRAQIRELFKKTSNTEQILLMTKSLEQLSDEDKEDLEIKEYIEPTVDEMLVDILVSIYVKMAKMPNKKDISDIKNAISLDENEELEEIDTTAFEEELRQYFTEHYADLMDEGYNYFLANITEVPDQNRVLHKEYGDLAKMAIKHNINPERFKCFGYQLTIQEGIIAEEDSTFGRSEVFYATEDGINKRIYYLYSKALYKDQESNGLNFDSDRNRKLKNTYITYAEKNGIEIKNTEALETLDVNMVKVQALAKYINKKINSLDNEKKEDYTQLFVDDIIKNYSKIMNLQYYNFSNLESVQAIAGEHVYINSLYLKMEEDSIIYQDDLHPDIAYGTPQYIKAEYENVMKEVKELHKSNAFATGKVDIAKANRKKYAFRRYIQENDIEGIDIEIPPIEVNHDKINMIVDALMEQYGTKCEDKDTMRSKILSKIEDNWSEIMTEYQCMHVRDLIEEELKELGKVIVDETLYVKDDFIYLANDVFNTTAKCIYATPEALENNISAIDSKILSKNLSWGIENARKALEQYAKENDMDLDILDIETIKARRQQEKEIFSFGINFERFDIESMPDDPTAREKLELNDTIMDTIMKMTDGNPGAITGLASLLKADKTGGMLLLGLDDMNIRSSQIWIAYKYLFNENGERFAKAVSARDKKMVDFINQELASVGGEKAVTGGASFDRHKTPNKYRFTEEEVEQLKKDREERINREKEQREKMLANSPAKKNRAAKKRAERESKRQEYKQKLIAMGKKSLKELDQELTDLQEKEREAKKLCEQYEQQLPYKLHEEV